MTAPPSRELRRGGPVLSHTPQDGAQSALHWQETPASSPRSTFLPRRAMTCPPGGATELSRPALPRVLQAQRRPGSKHRLLRPGAEMRGPGTVVGNLGRGTWPCLKSRRGGGRRAWEEGKVVPKPLPTPGRSELGQGSSPAALLGPSIPPRSTPSYPARATEPTGLPPSLGSPQ